jgi:hypothetical protein
MPIQFPPSPSVNQEYTYEGKVWAWDGSSWVGVRQETGIQKSNIWAKQNLLIPKRGFGLNSGYNGTTDQRRTAAGTIPSLKHYMERDLGVFSSSVLWTPAQITTALWLDADDDSTITLNGSNVSQWNDKSGNGRHATQATAANQPAYTTAGLNGKNVITLSQNQLSVALTLSNQGWDAFVVASLSSSSNSFARLLSLRTTGQANDFDNTTSWLPIYRNSSTNEIGAYQNGSGTSPLFTVTYNAVNIINSKLDSGLKFFVNGSEVGSKGSSSNLNTTDGLLIGQSLNSFDENWDGILAEVIFVNNLQTIDRQRIEGYLAHKWGLTSSLPNDHPYKSSQP